MIKKLGNKSLLLILIIFLAIFGLARYFSNKSGENTFKTAIIPKIDSARMNGMIIFQKPTKKEHPAPFVFTLKNKEWYVSQGNVSGRAEQRAANYIVKLMEQITPDRLASNDTKDWKEYNVTDSLGTRIVFLYDKDTALDVIVGRFSYIPQRKQGISYIRIAGQKEVYAVDGYLTMNVNNEFENWRDKKMMPGEYNTWTKLTFTYPADSGFVITKDSNNQWVFGNGAKPDSATAVNVIRSISSQNYGSFVNNFDSNGKQPMFTLRLEGKGFGTTIIKAYPAADTANKYVINSTINPASFFGGNKGEMFSKVFPGKSLFSKKGFDPAARHYADGTKVE